MKLVLLPIENLLRALLLPLIASSLAAEEPVSDVLRWVGTGYQEGDAFTISAHISGKRVNLHWDGFTGSILELGPAPPPRGQRDFSFTDEATVQAFKTLAGKSDQWDPGYSDIIGVSQGLTIRASVESPPGQVIRQVRGFHSPGGQVKSDRFARIAWLVKGMDKPEAPAEVPAASEISTHIRELADDLSRFDRVRSALLLAYQTNGGLPLKELETLRVPIPLARAIEQRRLKDQTVERTQQALVAECKVLRDCFGTAQRAAFTGTAAGEGGVLILLESASANKNDEVIAVPVESFPVKLGPAGTRVASLPPEMEGILTDFVTGAAFQQLAGAREKGLIPSSVYGLEFGKEGQLQIGIHHYGQRWKEKFAGQVNLDFILQDRETLSRLDYLNSKGIARFLLGGDLPADKKPASVRILSLNVNPKDFRSGTMQVSMDGRWCITEIAMADGKWTAGKIWEWDAYWERKKGE